MRVRLEWDVCVPDGHVYTPPLPPIVDLKSDWTGHPACFEKALPNRADDICALEICVVIAASELDTGLRLEDEMAEEV